jgi:hypothetical protein
LRVYDLIRLIGVEIMVANDRAAAIEVVVYSSGYRKEWDNFISQSKNGVFLFYRNYMEYHKNRFKDNSLLFFNNNRLVAVLPANLANMTLQSHGGLTFGGVISNNSMKTALMLGVFEALLRYCRNQGISELTYKPVPCIYHTVPAQEDLYALFINNAKLIARNVSSCISLSNKTKFAGNRRDNIRKAKRNNLQVQQSLDFNAFMKIEEENLVKRHGVKPVHTAEEITLLAERFPNNIKLFGSFKDSVMLAGVIVYESRNVAHMQYASNSVEGWNLGAQDIIEDYLINDYYKGKRYFDFGISTEKFGQVLNLGLIKRKENFGASAVMYDFYQMVI